MRKKSTKSLWPQTFAVCAAVIFASGAQIDVVVEPNSDLILIIAMAVIIGTLIGCAVIYRDR